ncbi:hypothetical protein OF83DRAFT_675199 [Amylostereum chailletii]|nr:hypothetical protein OF83DRAFT_675199 [Amylostereum chailletii]
MPGPRKTKKSKAQAKKDKRERARSSLADDPLLPSHSDDNKPTGKATSKSEQADEGQQPRSGTVDPDSKDLPPIPPVDLLDIPSIPTPSPHESPLPPTPPLLAPDIARVDPDPVLALFERASILHDPGTGPRVRDIPAFLSSSFAQPTGLDDPLCAEFAQVEVLQMLRTVLPEETATLLWYNKSRKFGRVCPTCHRLYSLGDVLPSPVSDPTQPELRAESASSSPQLLKEQILSGLCSPICFIMAAYNYPDAIRSTWGRLAEELDDATWALLNGPGEGQQESARGLSMLLKMTRLHDLGLAQLCVPDLGIDEEIYISSAESSFDQSVVDDMAGVGMDEKGHGVGVLLDDSALSQSRSFML